MQELRKSVIQLILTSGTLSPLDSYASELEIDFPIRLENPHVISDWQVRHCFFIGDVSDLGRCAQIRTRRHSSEL